MPTSNSVCAGLDTSCGPELASHKSVSDVLICEEQDTRFQLVNRLLTTCGTQIFRSDHATVRSKLPDSARFALALVALDDYEGHNWSALETARICAHQGMIVICYADGARAWPLRKRCRVLLAGALSLFDSTRPEFPEELKRTLEQVLQLERAKRDEEARTKSLMRGLGVIGESRVMRSIFSWVQRVSALSDLPALITGETGTGKELLVNAIHHLDGKRSRGPLVALNCGAITAGVAESELFGHRRGAFTGAERDRMGLVRAANGGILFLDEIGDLDGPLQSKLLRVLQESRVLGVGEDRELPVNVRVIAATNRNLEEMVAQGTFRADLFHRLNILSIHIPPLRQRREDVKPLVAHFIEKHSALVSSTTPAFDAEFIEALEQLELPGNAREVENLVRRALVNRNADGPLGLTDLPPEILAKLVEQKHELTNAQELDASGELNRAPELPSGPDFDKSLFQLLRRNKGSLTRTLQHCERVLVATALELANGNQSRVAELLSITPRSVYNKLRKHRLTRITL
jgi:transcriptional regulator with PAS, ATPase and Fis domain